MSGITTPEQQRLWAALQTRPEWATTKFWEYIFKHNVFNGPRWSVASQQPPTDDEGDLRRVDLVVENIPDNFTLLFMEAKRADATADLIEEVEYQAFTACCAHLHHTGRGAVWAMTCVGSRARLWAYKAKADYITQFWPIGTGIGERGEYAEFSVDGRNLLKYLEYIKQHPTPGREVFKQSPSPRPTNVDLPFNWHDREVALMAQSAQLQAITGSSTQSYEPIHQAQHQSAQLQAIAGPSTQFQEPINQVQHQNINQSLVLKAETSTEVVVMKFEKNLYKCDRLSDGYRVHVPENDWSQCIVETAGQFAYGYTWTGNSGTTYYTWSLDVDNRKGKKVKR